MAKGTVWYKTRLCSLPKYKGPVPEDGKTTASYWKYHMLLIFTFSTDKPTPCLLPPSPPKQLSSCSREIRLQHTSYIGIFNPNGWRLVISRQKHVFPVEVRPAAPAASGAVGGCATDPQPAPQHCSCLAPSPASRSRRQHKAGLLPRCERSQQPPHHSHLRGTAWWARSTPACAPD